MHQSLTASQSHPEHSYRHCLLFLPTLTQGIPPDPASPQPLSEPLIGSHHLLSTQRMLSQPAPFVPRIHGDSFHQVGKDFQAAAAPSWPKAEPQRPAMTLPDRAWRHC